MFIIRYSIYGQGFNVITFFPSLDIKQNVLLSSYLDNWWHLGLEDLPLIILQSNGPQVEKGGRTEIQKNEYLENEKSFLDEIKSIFHSFWKAIIWWKNKNLMKIVDTNFKSYGILGQIFDLISFFLSNRWLQVGLDGKSSYKYHKYIIQSILYINDLPDDVVCNIAIYADDATLYSKRDQASDMWEQLELDLRDTKSDLRDTVDWGKKWPVDFNAGKTQLILFDWSNNNGSVDKKMDRPVLEEKSSFKMVGLTFSSKLDWGSYIMSISIKLPQRKVEL